MNFLKVNILVTIFVTATAYSSPNFKQWDMVWSHFVIMVQNCGTPSQQRLRSLKIYTISRKMLLNGAHQLNVMCSSYNGIHDIYIFVCIYISCIYLYIYYSIWNLSHHFIGFICSSVYHLVTLLLLLNHLALYVRFTMWNVLSTSNFTMILKPLFFFRCLLPKDKMIMFYCFHELYESFGDMDAMHQICDISTGILTVYICISFYWALRVCTCVCVRVCILQCDFELCMHVFIVGQ